MGVYDAICAGNAPVLSSLRRNPLLPVSGRPAAQPRDAGQLMNLLHLCRNCTCESGMCCNTLLPSGLQLWRSGT